MIQTTNDGFGLLRALGPDIASFIGFTILLVVVLAILNIYVESSARRSVRGFGFAIWALVLAMTIVHSASMSVSLRIPRSDVNATGVFEQMDANTR